MLGSREPFFIQSEGTEHSFVPDVSSPMLTSVSLSSNS